MRKSKYAQIGKSGTGDKFLEAFNKVSSPIWFIDSAERKRDILINEAVKAFNEGHPENVQVLVAEGSKDIYSVSYSIALALHKLSEGIDDKLAAIELAFAKVPEQDKNGILNKTLKEAIYNSLGGEPFCSLLYKSGASFDDVLSIMYSAKYRDEAAIDRLKFFQEKIAGKTAVAEIAQPAAEDADIHETLRLILEQVTELTQEVKRQGALNQPGKIKPATEKKPYPSLNGPGHFKR